MYVLVPFIQEQIVVLVSDFPEVQVMGRIQEVEVVPRCSSSWWFIATVIMHLSACFGGDSGNAAGAAPHCGSGREADTGSGAAVQFNKVMVFPVITTTTTTPPQEKWQAKREDWQEALSVTCISRVEGSGRFLPPPRRGRGRGGGGDHGGRSACSAAHHDASSIPSSLRHVEIWTYPTSSLDLAVLVRCLGAAWGNSGYGSCVSFLRVRGLDS